jgi:ABC-type transporter Mla MlaB component
MHDITLTIPEDSRVAAIGDIKADMMNALDSAKTGASIILDLGKVRRADSSLAQLILSFKSEASAKGFSIRVKGDEGDYSLPALLCCDAIIEPGKTERQGALNSGGGVS